MTKELTKNISTILGFLKDNRKKECNLSSEIVENCFGGIKPLDFYEIMNRLHKLGLIQTPHFHDKNEMGYKISIEGTELLEQYESYENYLKFRKSFRYFLKKEENIKWLVGIVFSFLTGVFLSWLKFKCL